MPLFFHGHEQRALGNIQSTIALFAREDVQAVIVDCATCGSALRTEYARVLANLGHSPDRTLGLADKVWDVTEFVAQDLEALQERMPRQGEQSPLRVTYHSPCHLRNTQKCSAQIADFLHALPGVEYVQAADWERCCGGGGTFFYEYPEITRHMVSRKIENAQVTGAELWLTGCPGCRMNLSGNMPDQGGLAVKHPIEVVARLLHEDTAGMPLSPSKTR